MAGITRRSWTGGGGRSIDTLEQHPNLSEILGILAQLAHITDADLTRLAAAWENTTYIADARALALLPDSPLVLDVLGAFEAVAALFADDLAGEADYVTVEPRVTSLALKAVRDAIAAAYSRPALHRGHYLALMRPWREVYPLPTVDEPDLGPRAEEVKALLRALPRLARRCHDANAAATFATLTEAAVHFDDTMREMARREIWSAAVLTSRRRVWALVRRSGLEAIGTAGRPCPTCAAELPDDGAREQVLELCLDAACALLVADAVDDTMTEILTLPLAALIPAQREASS